MIIQVKGLEKQVGIWIIPKNALVFTIDTVSKERNNAMVDRKGKQNLMW